MSNNNQHQMSFWPSDYLHCHESQCKHMNFWQFLDKILGHEFCVNTQLYVPSSSLGGVLIM